MFHILFVPFVYILSGCGQAPEMQASDKVKTLSDLQERPSSDSIGDTFFPDNSQGSSPVRIGYFWRIEDNFGWKGDILPENYLSGNDFNASPDLFAILSNEDGVSVLSKFTISIDADYNVNIRREDFTEDELMLRSCDYIGKTVPAPVIVDHKLPLRYQYTLKGTVTCSDSEATGSWTAHMTQ